MSEYVPPERDEDYLVRVISLYEEAERNNIKKEQ